MRKYGQPRNVVTDGLCSYLAAMKQQESCGGLTDREQTQSPADLRALRGVGGALGLPLTAAKPANGDWVLGVLG